MRVIGFITTRYFVIVSTIIIAVVDCVILNDIFPVIYDVTMMKD